MEFHPDFSRRNPSGAGEAVKEESGRESEPMWTIRAEEPGDAQIVEALVARSFGPGRYAKSAYRLREGVAIEAGLSFVAVEDGTLKGSVRFWPIAVGEERALLLGPLAVETKERGRGMGLALMQHGIDAARARGHGAILLVGDVPYYSRVGFAAVPDGRVTFPGPVDPARILALGLSEGAFDSLKGAIRRARIDDPVCADGAAVA
jgi:predicted N-acetyltransferase YhbS